MPDGTTTSVGEDGKLSVNTAQQDALGVVKGSDDITVGEDGTLTVNTTFKQATELANIIAGEAIKSVLGKVSKAIATTMNLDENALLKNMISGIDVMMGTKCRVAHIFIRWLNESEWVLRLRVDLIT